MKFSFSRNYFLCFGFAVLLLSCGQPSNVSQVKKYQTKQQVSFAVVGDLMVHDSQLKRAYQKSCDCYRFDKVFEEVRDYISTADIAIANFETTLPGEKVKYSGYPTFGSPDSFLEAVVNAGFDILTTANNHSMDKGRLGLHRTLQILDQKKILHLGTYKDKEEWQKSRVLMVKKNGLRLAFLNYTYGTNGIRVPNDVVVNLIDTQKIKDDMKIVHQQNPDAVIVLFHFGAEYSRFPDNFQKKIVNLVLEQGADVVLGGHPHVLQPYEILQVKDIYGRLRDCLVIYSLGNFVSGQQRRYTDGGTIFQFTLEKTKDENVNIQIDSESKGSSAEIRFLRINDIPVWVYFAENQGEVKVLPAEIYMQKEKQLKTKLPPKSQKKLEVFYNDTTLHYRDSRDKIKLYFSKKN